jgi:protein-L-isoaspartate(D-aspartate) O-methyltransferase
MITIDQARTFYAEEVRFAAGVRNPAVWEAFNKVPRERFLGSGPWRIAFIDPIRGPIYTTTDDGDPRRIYHNVSIALDESRHIVSGQPSALAGFFDDLSVQPGERVIHLGSGVGYYTAILAEIVGPHGSVVATEVDPELAARARENLSPYSWVAVHEGPGLPADCEPGDALIMNAGVTHLEPSWLEHLRDGGRLLAALTVSVGPTLGTGFMFKVTRSGDEFRAQLTTPTVIYSAVGLRDSTMELILRQMIGTGTLWKASVVRTDAHAPAGTCVLHRPGACLSMPASAR